MKIAIPYRVKIWKTEGIWMASIPTLNGAHTQAGSLSGINEMVQHLYTDYIEAINEWGLDLPPSDLDGWSLAYMYNFGNADELEMTFQIKSLR